MSVQRVQEFLNQNAPGVSVIELDKPTASVVQAAEAFGVQHGQIAKTLSFNVNGKVILLVIAGDHRLDNRKYKSFFGVKARMLPAEDVEPLTGFAPGGVCPFGVNTEVKVYCDESLKLYQEVLPAGGSSNSGVRISPQQLAAITNAEWVDLGSL